MSDQDAAARATAVRALADGASVYPYLKSADKALLAKAYEQASQNGEDVRKADMLAFDLANYRPADDGKGLIDTRGKIFTFDGSQVVEFVSPPEEQVIADRVLSSAALRTTELDQNFVRAILNPHKMSHTVEPEFLEKIVTSFSWSSIATPAQEASEPQRSKAADARTAAQAEPPQQSSGLPEQRATTNVEIKKAGEWRRSTRRR